MKTSTYRVIMAAAFALLALRHLAQTTGDIATFKKASGPGDVKTYTTPVNSSLFSLNSSGNFALLPQSTFQPALVSGTNLRTVQGVSLLGSGNIAIIDDAINDGVTTAGPSQNAVFDALAGKAASSHTHVSADITDASAGGNGVADAGKLVVFGPAGGITVAVDGTVSTNGLDATLVGGGGGAAVSGFADTGLGGQFVTESSANPALECNSQDPTYAGPLFHAHNLDGEGLEVLNDGGLDWTSLTGAQTTATNLPTFGSSTKGVVPASGGGTTNFLRADGTWAAPSGGGGGVTSFNGRNGTVVSATGDYDASQVNNDSNVPGASVAEALDQLDADKLEDGDVLSTGLVFGNTNGVQIRDAGNDHTLGLRVGGNLPANWTLNLLPNADGKTLTVADDASVSGTNTGDQTLNSLLPTQTGNSGKYLTTDGTNASWGTVAASASWGSITGTLSSQTDLNSALSGKEPTISAGTTGQYWRGDKSWQTLDATAVGLGNVENTALSTWTGSSSLTTLGTVATGKWQADAVTVPYGGTGVTTLTGIVKGNGTSAFSAAVAGTDYLEPTGSGSGLTALPSNTALYPTLNQNTTGSAATLTTARTIQTNLASGSSASFNGSANITPGVTGTLPIGNGGTGAATREAAEEALTRTTESTPLGSDFTTSSTSAVDVTGLSLSVASNSTYRYEVWCEWASNNTSGTVTPNVTGPAGATVTGYRQATLAASTVTNGAIGISTTAAGTANSRQFMVMHGICNTSGTSGTLQVTLASSSGHTARIYAGATIRATKVQ